MNGRNIGRAAGFVAAGVIAGGVLAGSLTATAQTPSPSPSGTARAQRSDETPLTGGNAAKAKAAALKAVPGATVERVETDADGDAVYEAHVVKADGTRATVLMDKDFTVLSVRDCPAKGGGAPAA